MVIATLEFSLGVSFWISSAYIHEVISTPRN